MQTLDGRWLSIDGRVLFKATVAASETYNTALEHHLRDTLGVRFAERADSDPRLRPIREIVGVDPALNRRWSARRASIESRRGELAPPLPARPRPATDSGGDAAFGAAGDVGDAQRQARTPHSDRAADVLARSRPRQVLGGRQAVDAMVQAALHPSTQDQPERSTRIGSLAAADRVLAAMEEHRSTWQIWHVRAEAQRQVRAANLTTDKLDAAGRPARRRSAQHQIDTRSPAPTTASVEPASLRRADGSSVYTVAGADLFTSARILDAERRLGRHRGPH